MKANINAIYSGIEMLVWWYELYDCGADIWKASEISAVFTAAVERWFLINDVTGLWKGTIDVAIKTLKFGTMTPEKFLAEASIMKRLRHQRIVRLYAVCSIDEPILIVTELMTKGSLQSYVRSNKNLLTKELIDIAAQVWIEWVYIYIAFTSDLFLLSFCYVADTDLWIYKICLPLSVLRQTSGLR